MGRIQSYPKVINLGSVGTFDALKGPVIIQEKVDGSQFRFGLDIEGKICICSKGRELHSEQLGMFKTGFEYIMSKEKELRDYFIRNASLYGEYLAKPKHNTLKYNETPKNNIVLFDGINDGVFMHRVVLKETAEILDIDLIPEFHAGEITIENLKEFHNRESYLGGEKVEGIVIKNYGQKHPHREDWPLFTKYVREEFRERHQKNPQHNKKASINEYLMSFRSEARWEKAIQWFRDAGKLEEDPRDIGPLIKHIILDLDIEESANIKVELYDRFIKDIRSCVTRGFAEWYKDKLLENVK